MKELDRRVRKLCKRKRRAGVNEIIVTEVSEEGTVVRVAEVYRREGDKWVRYGPGEYEEPKIQAGEDK